MMKAFLFFIAASSVFAQSGPCTPDTHCVATGAVSYTVVGDVADEFRTMSFGPKMSFTFTGLEDGVYVLTLGFIEPTYKTAGARLMNVLVNDVPMLQGFDLGARAGFMVPIKRSMVVSVVGGRLRLDMSAPVGKNAMLSNISLAQIPKGSSSSSGKPFAISAVGGKTLDFGTDCASTPCNVGPANNPTTFNAPMNISDVKGATRAVIGIDLISPARGKVVLDSGSAYITGGGGGVWVTGTVPPDMLVQWDCAISNGTFTKCDDRRGVVVSPPVTGHSGVICVPLEGQTDCVLDTAAVPTLSTVPASSTDKCSPPQFAKDREYFYLCVDIDLWRRVPLTW